MIFGKVNFRHLAIIAALFAGIAQASTGPKISSYQLTESDLQILSAPEKILQILSKQVDEVYPDTTQLLNAIQTDLIDHPDISRTISGIVRLDLKLPSKPTDTAICLPEAGFPCPVKQIGLDSASLASLQAKLVAKRKLHTLPAPLLDLIREVVNVDYPEEELFHQAVLSRLDAGIGTCSANLSTSQTYMRSLRLADTAYTAMMEQLIPLSPSLQAREIGGNSTVGLLTTYRNSTTPCSMSDKDQIHKILQGIYDSTLRETLHGLCRKSRSASPKAPLWSGGSCGCVRADLNGMVYGFYPWWQADTTVQTLDFSVVSHIEFYGLSFDNAGVLTEFDPSPDATRFLSEARAHGNRVDWVISRSDWDDWLDQPLSRRQATFDTLAGRILSLLTKPLPDAWSHIKSALPYPTRERFTWGDGATLHFSNFPTDPVSVDLFTTFVRRLDSLMTKADPTLNLNLLFPRTTLTQNLGIYSYAKLVDLLRLRGVDSAELHEERTHLLVLLDEPSRDTKKILQRELDFQLHGKDRKLFVRALVPVSVFDGKNWQQLTDDILYDNDTYYGMGLWPVPFANAKDAAKPDNTAQRLAQTILDSYQMENAKPSRLQWLNDTICLYRWEIRFLLLASIFFSIAVGVATALHCPLRHFLSRHVVRTLAALVVPPLGLFTLLLYFDPDLTALSQGNAPFVALATLTVLGAAGTGIYLRSQKAKPSREALREEMRRMGGGK